MVTIALQGLTLLAALRVSGAHRFLVRAATAITVVAVITATGIVIGPGELGADGGRLVSLMLVLLAPAAIIAGIVRQARASGAITVRTMFGVLCVYLLLGATFGLVFGVVSSLESEPFFAQLANPTQSDFLYFSFETLTTTGYGDLTAATDSGRSLAVTETLFGQIYLVTVVALIVSNVGRPRAQAR